mmetsp:Transcript_29724/g.74697  ORF Transcript_29724/g.74697 Transcript_29724/m.74697 type:complete len:218 (-) Transcript_29724:341-994(-)
MYNVLDQRESGVFWHLAHQAKIDDAQVSLRRSEEVPRVRVGVEEAVLEELSHGALDAHGDEVQGVKSHVSYAHCVGELYAVDPLHDNNPSGRQLRVDLWHLQASLVAVAIQEALRILGLVFVVQLLEDPLAKRVYEANEVVVPEAFGQEVFVGHQQLGELPCQDHVQAYLVLQVGPLDLHSHRATIEQASTVDLAQRRRGHGCVTELCEAISERTQE